MIMESRFYRVVNAEAIPRIPFEGLKNTPETVRMSIDGTKAIVERENGHSTNERWMSHSEAVALIAEPEWFHSVEMYGQ